jgi:type III secretion protein R
VTASSVFWLVVMIAAPLLVLTVTSFVKISVVLASVRSAIGAQDLPSNLLITAMSLMLTVFVMAPVALQMVDRMQNADAPAPAPAPTLTPAPTPAPSSVPTSGWMSVIPSDSRSAAQKLDLAAEPLRTFLQRRTAPAELETFRKLAAAQAAPASASGQSATLDARKDPLWVLAPAFLVTELKSAFSIAVLLLLPFLLIDVLIAVTLGSLGLHSLDPKTVALPLKLLLFVAVDGWRLLVEGLLRGYT